MQYANYVVVYHILYCIFLLVVRFRYLISAHGPSARIGYRFKQQSVVATYQVFFTLLLPPVIYLFLLCYSLLFDSILWDHDIIVFTSL
jgi:succinate dehydrogenase/fumarate reductase cytochrome b subunit